MVKVSSAILGGVVFPLFRDWSHLVHGLIVFGGVFVAGRLCRLRLRQQLGLGRVLRSPGHSHALLLPGPVLLDAGPGEASWRPRPHLNTPPLSF